MHKLKLLSNFLKTLLIYCKRPSVSIKFSNILDIAVIILNSNKFALQQIEMPPEDSGSFKLEYPDQSALIRAVIEVCTVLQNQFVPKLSRDLTRDF